MKLLFTIVLSLFFLACSLGKKNNRAAQLAKYRMVEAISEGDTLNLHVRDSIKISLYNNPSTGYYWEWENNRNEHMDSIGNEFVSENNPENLDGVGGTDIWIFKAKKAGFDSLVMIHHRGDEKENAFYSKFFINIY